MSPVILSKRGRTAVIAVVLILAVAAVAVGIALSVTSRPAFFERYQGLARRHTTLATSAHKGIDCSTCHVDKRGALISGAARVGEFYRSIVTSSTDLAFVKFGPPASAACLECHRYAWSTDASRTAKVPHPAHLRVSSETRDCVTCHKWVAHEEPYQAKHKTMPFSGVCASFGCHVGVKQSSECANCHHVLQGTGADWKANHQKVVRASGPNACLQSCHNADQCRTCHTTGKTPVLPSSIATAAVSAIEALHVEPDWLSAHGPIALQDPVKCTICHISEGECQDCHAQRPAFHGPASTWLNRHQPLSTAQPQRCLTCHKQYWCDACHAQFKEKQ